MALTDPIADGLTVIRHANRIKKERVDIPASQMIKEIMKILRQEKFISDYRLIEDQKQGVLRVYLRKPNENLRAITKIVRVSKPGLRIYS